MEMTGVEPVSKSISHINPLRCLFKIPCSSPPSTSLLSIVETNHDLCFWSSSITKVILCCFGAAFRQLPARNRSLRLILRSFCNVVATERGLYFRTPVETGTSPYATNRTRTCNRLITNQMRYQLRHCSTQNFVALTYLSSEQLYSYRVLQEFILLQYSFLSMTWNP